MASTSVVSGSFELLRRSLGGEPTLARVLEDSQTVFQRAIEGQPYGTIRDRIENLERAVGIPELREGASAGQLQEANLSRQHAEEALRALGTAGRHRGRLFGRRQAEAHEQAAKDAFRAAADPLGLGKFEQRAGRLAELAKAERVERLFGTADPSASRVLSAVQEAIVRDHHDEGVRRLDPKKYVAMLETGVAQPAAKRELAAAPDGPTARELAMTRALLDEASAPGADSFRKVHDAKDPHRTGKWDDLEHSLDEEPEF